MAETLIFASGGVDFNGALRGSQLNTTGAVRNAVGDYAISLETSVGPNESHILVTPQARTLGGLVPAAPVLVSARLTVGGDTVEVFCFDIAGNPVDANFDWIVFRTVEF